MGVQSASDSTSQHHMQFTLCDVHVTLVTSSLHRLPASHTVWQNSHEVHYTENETNTSLQCHATGDIVTYMHVDTVNSADKLSHNSLLSERATLHHTSMLIILRTAAMHLSSLNCTFIHCPFRARLNTPRNFLYYSTGLPASLLLASAQGSCQALRNMSSACGI